MVTGIGIGGGKPTSCDCALAVIGIVAAIIAVSIAVAIWGLKGYV